MNILKLMISFIMFLLVGSLYCPPRRGRIIVQLPTSQFEERNVQVVTNQQSLHNAQALVDLQVAVSMPCVSVGSLIPSAPVVAQVVVSTPYDVVASRPPVVLIQPPRGLGLRLADLTNTEKEYRALHAAIITQRTLMRAKRQALENKQRLLQENPNSVVYRLDLGIAQTDLNRCAAALCQMEERHQQLSLQISD